MVITSLKGRNFFAALGDLISKTVTSKWSDCSHNCFKTSSPTVPEAPVNNILFFFVNAQNLGETFFAKTHFYQSFRLLSLPKFKIINSKGSWFGFKTVLFNNFDPSALAFAVPYLCDMHQAQVDFFELLQKSLSENTFIKLNLSNYNGTEPELEKLLIKRILIKSKEHLNINYRFKTNDISKNFGLDEGVLLLQKYTGEHAFRSAMLYTTRADYQLSIDREGKAKVQKHKASVAGIPDLHHDKQKQRHIETAGKNAQYLNDLGITDANGKVYKNGQDKFRQINHYIEVLSSLLKNLDKQKHLKIADMGAGKGYLTFALYDYLVNNLGYAVSLTGVEYREDLVQLCNGIAAKAGFTGLKFEQGTIQDYVCDNLDVLIALHACDTATDDAIAKGVTADADLIVVAPCCHKQIRRQMEQSEKELNFLTRHGIFMERQAEMVTDGLRALLLEKQGYKTKVFEFVSDAHTPKNIMIVGQKRADPPKNTANLDEQIAASKAFYGIKMHHLEKLLGL